MVDREIKWTKYLWLSLLSFGAFMLEYFSIFVIESILLHVDIWNYVGSFYCNATIFFSEVFLFSFKKKQRGKALFGKLDNNICLLNWLQNFDFY